MAETHQFDMPLLAGSQAQKHVTVNEALAILDAVAQFRIASASISTPPTALADGTAYLIPTAATGVWTGLEGQIAIAVNDGWRFVTPKAGWQVFNAETGATQLFDGFAWLDSTLAARDSGAATGIGIVEIDHVLDPGNVSISLPVIPANALVIGVTGRVTAELTGPATSWRLGVQTSDDRYGTGYGLQVGSFVRGMTSTPMAYFADEALFMTGEGGDFTGGAVKFAVHYLTLTPPRP